VEAVLEVSAIKEPGEKASLAGLLESYEKRKQVIKDRLAFFRGVGETYDDPKLFAELAFCICTPQSSARRCDSAIQRLAKSGLLFHGGMQDIASVLQKEGVRFPGNKAKFILEARYHLLRDGLGVRTLLDRFRDARQFREWLVKNVKGFGYKEASHFLRNIGRGEELAILDRHILKNLQRCGVIESVPETLKARDYLDIEKKMAAFAQRVGIPMAELDLLFWSQETGEVFK